MGESNLPLDIHTAVSQVRKLRLGNLSKVIKFEGFRSLTLWLQSLAFPHWASGPSPLFCVQPGGRKSSDREARETCWGLDPLTRDLHNWMAKTLFSSAYVV